MGPSQDWKPTSVADKVLAPGQYLFRIKPIPFYPGIWPGTHGSKMRITPDRSLEDIASCKEGFNGSFMLRDSIPQPRSGIPCVLVTKPPLTIRRGLLENFEIGVTYFDQEGMCPTVQRVRLHMHGLPPRGLGPLAKIYYQ